jgi:chromosome partitioning protein
MHRLAIVLSKGGVGKTTTAVNLAHGLARGGARVLLTDCDSQGQCATALGVEPAGGLADLVNGASFDAVAIEARPRLWLLAGGRPLAGLRREIARRDFGSERVIAGALEGVRGFDYLVLDTAPGWDVLTVNALFAVSDVLAPVSMEPLAAEALGHFEAQLADIRRYHAALTLRHVVPTFVDGRVAKSAEILAQLVEAYGDMVTAPIRYSARLSESAAFGRTIFEHDPRGRGAQDYAALAETIKGVATDA